MIQYRQILLKTKHFGLFNIICNKSYVTKPSLSSYSHKIGREPLVYRTVGQQFKKICEKYSDREAIVSCYNQQRFTYQEVLDKVDTLARNLNQIGLKRGDTIGIWSPNTAHWYIMMIATAKAGLVSVAMNPAYQATELAYFIKKVDMKAIFSFDKFKTQNYYEIITSVIPEIKSFPKGDIRSKEFPMFTTVIMDSEKQFSGAYNFNELLNLSVRDDIPLEEPQPDDDCNIQFTSGTTGKPKAAVLSHFNLINNGIFSGYRNDLHHKHHRICIQNPLFHVYGVVIGIMAAIAHGSTLVLPGLGFNPTESLYAINREKCTVIYGTPTMYVDLIARQKEFNVPIDSAEIALTGGAPCSPQLYKNIKSTFKLQKVKNLYGLTETTASCFHSIENESDDIVLNTVGYLQDHLEAKVVDKNGNLVPMGAQGELCIRGYSTMLRYYKDDEKTKEIISYDKWLKTGDQFILYANGSGQIVGRFKEMIIRGGENIYPKEIEDFLNTHPDIIESQVIGVPDERMGEEMCAYIRVRQNAMTEINQSELKKFSIGKIAHFKVPRYIKIVENYPTTPSGKIQKFMLKQHFIENKESTKF